MGTFSGRLKLTFLVLAVLCASGFLPPSYGGKLVVPLGQELSSLDPLALDRANEVEIGRLLYDTLYRKDGASIVPWLVKSEALEEKGRIWKIEIKDRIVFSDGQILKANHIKNSLERLKNSNWSFLLTNLTKIVALDHTHLRLTFKYADRHWRDVFALPQSAIIIKKGKNTFIGTGGYKVVSFSSNALHLRVRDDYFKGRAYLDTLVFRYYSKRATEIGAYQIGRLNLSFRGKSVFGGKPRYPSKRIEGPEEESLVLIFGKRDNLKDHMILHQALYHGIDLKRISRMMTKRGESSDGRILDTEIADRVAVDMKKANALVKAVKEQLNRDELRFSLMVDGTQKDDLKLAKLLVAQLDSYGILLHVERVDARRYRMRLSKGDYQLALRRIVFYSKNPAIRYATVNAYRNSLTRARKWMSFKIRVFQKSSRLYPLLKMHRIIDMDERLGGVTLKDGYLDYSRIYWQRGR